MRIPTVPRIGCAITTNTKAHRHGDSTDQTRKLVKSYHCQVEIAAPAAAVFKALTPQEPELKGWWTTTCQVRTGTGSRSTFRLGKTHNVMWTEKFLPNLEVAWKCLEQHHESAELRRKEE